jgi:hypothetical protein
MTKLSEFKPVQVQIRHALRSFANLLCGTPKVMEMLEAEISFEFVFRQLKPYVLEE